MIFKIISRQQKSIQNYPACNEVNFIPGSPEVTLTGIKAEVGVRIVGVGNGRFKCSYVPVVPGAYLLHINWNGRQLRGSPYKVNVIGAFYPNKVVVSGEGIHGGILGREIDVRIDTRKAGPGIEHTVK